MKEFLWVSAIVGLVVSGYLIALQRDISTVNIFCSEMKAGLDVRK